MRKKNYKGRCEKRVLSKCPSVCKLYDPLQNAFADILDAQNDIQTIKCNVFLGNLEVGEYTTDFVCTLKVLCEEVDRQEADHQHLTPFPTTGLRFAVSPVVFFCFEQDILAITKRYVYTIDREACL